MDDDLLRLNEIAHNYLNNGRFQDAIDTLKSACKKAKVSLGEDDPIYAALVGSYGFLLHEYNHSPDSIGFLRKSIDIFEKIGIFDSEDYLLSLNNLAIVYHSIGLGNQAKTLYENAFHRINKEKYPLTYATVLINLSSFFSEEHRYDLALSNLFEAKSIFRQMNATKMPEYIGLLSHIGLCYCALRKFDKSDLYLDLALNLSIELKADQTAILNNFALNYFRQEKYGEAEILFRDLERKTRDAFGEKFFPRHNIFDNLAGVYIKQKKYEDAVQCVIESSMIIEQYLAEFAFFIPETNIQEPIATFRTNIDVLLSIFQVWEKIPQESIKKAYSMLIRKKAFFLNFEINRHKLILSEKLGKYQNEFDRLKFLKTELSHQKILAFQNGSDQTKISDSLKRIENEINKLYSEIPYCSKEFLGDSNLDDNYKKIFEKISSNTILLDFVRFNHIDFQKMAVISPKYVQFVITKKSGIRILDLGIAAEIDQLIQLTVEKISDCDKFEKPVTLLSNTLLTPIARFLDGKKQMIIVPDGLFNLLPFSVLKNNNDYLIKQFKITYLTSSQDLLNNSNIEISNQTDPIIVADPDFNFSEEGEKFDPYELTGNRGSFEKCLESPTPRLEGTRAEGIAIHKITGGSLWLGENALKSRISGIQSPKYLHIATHGFFCPRLSTTSNEINSLFRSGLLFAGVDSYLNGHSTTKNTGNGILTAFEVSMLDLTSTELVVLSACDTGVGEIINTEGVMGLRRSFSVAGAKALIMSLWSVDDTATKELMIYFYSHLKSGFHQSEALRQAQLSIIKKYMHPYYWAAFICQTSK